VSDVSPCHDEAVTTAPAGTALARGYEALAVGNWSEARAALEEAVSTAESPEALDGLGRSLWWLREGARPSSVGAGLMRQLTEEPVAARA
jgi:hypothetical protein